MGQNTSFLPGKYNNHCIYRPPFCGRQLFLKQSGVRRLLGDIVSFLGVEEAFKIFK